MSIFTDQVGEHKQHHHHLFMSDYNPNFQCYVNIYKPGWGAQAKSEMERLLHGWCRSRSGSECQDDHRHSRHIQKYHHRSYYIQYYDYHSHHFQEYHNHRHHIQEYHNQCHHIQDDHHHYHNIRDYDDNDDDIVDYTW